MKKKLNEKVNKDPHLIYHIFIALISCVMLVVIIQWDKGLFKADFREGDIAMRAIYAPYDFSIKGEMDANATDLARKSVIDAVLPTYVFDAGAQDTLLKRAESIINSIGALRDTPEVTDDQRQERITDIAISYGLSEEMVTKILALEDIQVFFSDLSYAIQHFMSQGIISAKEAAALKNNKTDKVRFVDKIRKIEGTKSIDEFLCLEDLKENMQDSLLFIKDKRKRAIVSNFINAILSINTTYDNEETQLNKRLAAQEVQPIYSIVEIKKNELILNKGERVGKEHILKLNGIEQNEYSAMKIGGIFAIAILVGLFVLLVGLYIKFYEPRIASGTKELTLLAVICILMLLTAKIIIVSPWPSNLVPISVASMLIAILINSRIAITTTCFLSILVGMISGNRLDIASVLLVGGIVGIFAIRGVRRRSQVIAAGICIGLANMSYLIVIGLTRSLDFSTYITEALFGFTNGIMSAVIVTGILPIFENVFKITTDISLLELADLNHPLLKEMVMKAPGTYHHSLVVGNLAEAACEAIGANSLLARVSSYFHDIGKIEKASYFSENQSIGDSMHDKLSPTMSSLIITNHVKNGVEVARQYKLNKNIVDVIKQHHGTGLVFYFFKRALEKVQDEEVGEQSFRYPGPKPQTKEAACVLLADSVEAASRALDNPTPSRIKGLAKKIINNKFIDGQLDECDLTLKDLEKIAEVFNHILTGIFHTRVEYPEGPQKSEKG